MWLDEAASTYKYSNNEAVKKSDEQLQLELNELKREIETNELVHGISFTRPFSSVPLPKDPILLARERKLFIEKLLNVHDTRPPYIQADVMLEQIESATKDEYNAESLPLLLHQFFLDKISWSIQSKHSHLLRWKRFSEHTNVIEDMYIDFKNRVSYIMSDFNDSVQRAQRLSAARESLLLNNSCSSALSLVQIEDISIYLRWLISHFYSQKSFQQAMKILEWLPFQISMDSFSAPNNQATFDSFELSSNTIFNSDHQAAALNQQQQQNSNYDSLYKSTIENSANNNFNNNSLLSTLNNKFNLLDKIFLPSGNAVVRRDEVFNSISFLFNQDEIPVHRNDLEFLLPRLRYLVNLYKIDYNLSRMQTSGDEMELFAAVNRKFRYLFSQQEHMKSFRVYDTIEVGTENWGADSPIHALKKEANWVSFIQLYPFKDPTYEKNISKIKQRNSIDQFLLPHSNFIEINNDERVQEALRENATIIKNQSSIEPISVTTNVTSFNTNALWKKVFYNPNLATKQENLIENENLDAPTSLSNAKSMSFRARTNKRLDDFNFVENLQKLGLDDSRTSEHNLTNVQGSYLSFLLLRHLRIRDLKRQALSLLNYFRSIEKTITIYDGGLSFESKTFKRQSAQNHMKETPYGGNLGYHAYMYNTPKDFKISEFEFMEFSEIENHDDFYSLDEQGFVHVQDQRGYYLIYDVALIDLKKLENELLAIASYYIAKDKETGGSGASSIGTGAGGSLSSRQSDNRRGKKTLSAQEINLNVYSHHNVDRFAILMDIWTNELMDMYYEAYQNVFDKAERRNLAQVITNLIYQRVRFDLDANYFTKSYRLEVSNLYKQISIVKIILDRMIDEMRGLLEKIEPDAKYGMPLSIIKKNPVFLTPNYQGNTLKNFYMLEFHPCLASASRIPSAIRQALDELSYYKCTSTVNERLLLEQTFLSKFLENLINLDSPGHSFTAQIQKEIFNGIFVEDPLLMTDFVDFTVKQLEETYKNKTKKEQSENILNSATRTLEMVTLRHRLICAALETEVLAKIYKKQANEMGFEDFHMNLRYVQFDFAKLKENAGIPPPISVSELNLEDSQIDRYTPNFLHLAIHEIDEGQIGRFSFKGKENVQQILRPGGIENLQLILKLQLTHNSALISSIMQVHSSILTLNLLPRKKPAMQRTVSNLADSSIKKKFSERNEIDFKLFDLKNISQVESPSSKIIMNTSNNKLKQFSDAFISIQLEKNPYRDLMLNEYIKQKELRGLALMNPVEMEKLKRNLMNEFSSKFLKRVIQYSLRSQLISLYYSITKILENFPNTRDNHFEFGEPFEKRINNKSTDFSEEGNNNNQTNLTDENMDYLKPDARMFKKRPRKILSDDGERILNIWFIPHYTELLTMYKKRSDDDCCKALKHCVRIIASLNDILHFLYANACMNIAAASGASSDSSTVQIRRKIDFTSWENAGGLDTELNEIQQEMNQLNDPCDPEQIAELLEKKRSTMFLQYECAIRFAVRDIFLANGSVEGYKLVTENMNFSLKFLSDLPIDTNENIYLSLPEPFDARDYLAHQFMPWRTFIAKNGSFPLHYWPWYSIEPNVTLCINCLKDVDKNVANGEILGVTLMMEDLLTGPASKNDDELFLTKTEAAFESANALTQNSSSISKSRVSLTSSSHQLVENNKNGETLTKQNDSTYPLKKCQLIHNYNKWHFYLMTWKRLELLKLDWGRRKLGVENICNSETFARFSESYKKDVLFPILKILVKSEELKDLYDNIVDFKQPILLPPDVSELQSKIKQITRLLEKLELSMIEETLQRVQKETKMVLAERGREENTLATDLWKKSIMKEEFTINKPHIAAEFSRLLYAFLKPNVSKETTQTDGNSSEKTKYLLQEKDLEYCLIRLGNMVQEREKSNFEQYTMFYENLLRQQHQLMYAREREIKSLNDLFDNKVSEINVEVQCQMADACYDLIMEVTALRSKLNEMVVTRENLEKELREQVKAEFIDLVADLVHVNTSLKEQIDQFKEAIHADVLGLLADARSNAFDLVAKLKNKFGVEIDKVAQNSQLNQYKLITDLQKERYELRILLLKQKNFAKLNLFRTSSNLNKKLTEALEMSDNEKRKAVEKSLTSEQKQIILIQQKQALKRQLGKLDAEYNSLKLKLEKELKEKLIKEHELQQKMKNEKNLNSAKQSNVEKLFEELEAKDVELRNLHMITEKSAKLHSINEVKIQKELTHLKRNLVQERNLKLDAFQKVDELQSHVYDMEDEITSLAKQSQSQIGNEKTTKNNRSNLTSALSNNAYRYTSPFPRLSSAQSTNLLNARPKTSIPKVKIEEQNEAETISTNIYHETISILKETTRLKSAKS